MKYQLGFHKPKPQKVVNHSRMPTFLGVIVMMLLFLQVMVSNRLATVGTSIAKIEKDVQQLNEENIDLRQKIASNSSLLVIENKAKLLGFTTEVKPIYISREPSVAFDLH